MRIKVEDGKVLCGWYALCENPAGGVVSHPVLGDVPACRRCADKDRQELHITTFRVK